MNNDKIVAYMLSEVTSENANIQILRESQDGVGFKADLQDTAEWNRNGRNYPLHVVKNALYRENIQELIQHGSWFGEAGHPIDPTVQRQMTVVQDNISHRILSFKIDKGMIKGELETAPTKQGEFMKKMILNKHPMESAFSLRAVGPVKKTSRGNMVQDPMTAVTYDWVFYPSHRQAYQTEINGINSKGNTLSECVFKPLLEANAISFIQEDSKNYKLLSNMMDIGSVTLSENCKSVIIDQANTDKNIKNKVVLKLEDYMSNEIYSYMSKF